MIETLSIALPFLVLIGVFIYISRRQNASYKAYLAEHTGETRKLVAQQEQTRATIERQTDALERIAAALEKRA